MSLNSPKTSPQTLHEAAINDDVETFINLVEGGGDPYSVDEAGFPPLFYAMEKKEGARKIVDWYQAHFPSHFPDFSQPNLISNIDALELDAEKKETYLKAKDNLKNLIILDDLINSKLRQCGLRSFLIDSTLIAEDLEVYINKLFNSFCIAPQGEELETINETTLSHFVFGALEEVPPLSLLEMLIAKYQTYPASHVPQKALGLYLIKELIKQDSENNYLTAEDFTLTLTDFLDKISHPPAFAEPLYVIKKLKSFYQFKSDVTFKSCQLSEVEKMTTKVDSALSVATKDNTNLVENFVQDLSQMMVNQLLEISPQHFHAKEVKNVNNMAWANMTNMMNHVSQMVCLDVLCADKHEQRVTIYQFYVSCIEQCFKGPIPNFAAAFAIYTGLNYAEVVRLDLTLYFPKNLHKVFDPKGGYVKYYEKTLNVPNAIAHLGLYVSIKTKGEENNFEAKILLYGKINATLFKDRLNATSYPFHPVRSQIKARLLQTALRYRETVAMRMSYKIKPLTIINLSKITTVAQLQKQLAYCEGSVAPLVVGPDKGFSKNLMHGHDAIKAIFDFVQQKFSDEKPEIVQDIKVQCSNIVVQFELPPCKLIHFPKMKHVREIREILNYCEQNKEKLIVCKEMFITQETLIQGVDAKNEILAFIKNNFPNHPVFDLAETEEQCQRILYGVNMPTLPATANIEKLSEDMEGLTMSETPTPLTSTRRACKKTRSDGLVILLEKGGKEKEKKNMKTNKLGLSDSAPSSTSDNQQSYDFALRTSSYLPSFTVQLSASSTQSALNVSMHRSVPSTKASPSLPVLDLSASHRATTRGLAFSAREKAKSLDDDNAQDSDDTNEEIEVLVRKDKKKKRNA